MLPPLLSCPHCHAPLAPDAHTSPASGCCPHCQALLPPQATDPTEAVWFVARQKQKTGPFSFDALKRLAGTARLAPDDMVWREGAPRWVQAQSLGLFGQGETVAASAPASSGPGPAGEAETLPVADSAADVPTTPPSPSAETLPPGQAGEPAGRRQVLVPGYEILGELGRGGMGVVYQARHLTLKRLVALKMILAGPHAGPDHIERFRTEAEAVARFQHPNIVQIYEVGEKDGLPYCALEYVGGGSLGQRLAQGPPSFEEAALLLERLARAMHYAHQRNVVHRDLKPANILLDEAGQPKITDFGLAKQLDTDTGQTHTGAIMGTPAYMAPEQAAGKVHDIGPATDVYALGVILYLMLTARLPFKADSLLETLEKVRTEEPPPPAQTNPRVPRDLETICLKCLRKEPAQRYTSALALAQDLERWQAGEPILARPEGLAGKVWRKVRRNRLAILTSLVVAATLATAAVLGVTLFSTRQQTTLQGTIETALNTPEWTPQQLVDTEKLVDQLEKLAPEQARGYRDRLLDRHREVLGEILAQPRLTPADAARFEEYLEPLAGLAPELAGQLRAQLRQRLGAWETLFDLSAPFAGWEKVFSPEDASVGEQALGRPKDFRSAGDTVPVALTRIPCQGNVEMEAGFDASWEDASEIGLQLHGTQGHTSAIFQVVSSPGGQVLATGAQDGTIRLWDPAAVQETHVLQTRGAVTALVFGKDGRRLYAGCGRQVLVVDAASGSLLQSRVVHKGSVSGLALSPDGRWLATAGDDRLIKLLDAATLEETASLQGHTEAVWQVAFSPDGGTLASSARDHTVRLWDVSALGDPGTVVPAPRVLAHRGAVASLAFRPDGRLLLAHCGSQVALWNPHTGKHEGDIPAPGNWASRGLLAFSPSGDTLVIGPKIYDGVTFEPRADLTRTLGSFVHSVALPSGGQLVLALQNRMIRIVDLQNGRVRRSLGQRGYSFRLAAAPRGQDEQEPLTLRQARRRRQVVLQIWRDGVCLLERKVAPPPGPVTLRARREGDRLLVQVGAREPVAFLDPVPLPGSLGYFGVHWPASVGLTQLRGMRQGRPARASSLEAGDELLAQGRHQEALDAYRGLLPRAAGAPAQEARYKMALCQLELSRIDEAITLLEQVAVEPGERWPMLAACQAWLLYLERDRMTEADSIFALLSARYRFGELLAALPEETRQAILQKYKIVHGVDFLLVKPADLQRLERATQILDFLEAPLSDRMLMRKDLMRVLALQGQDERALQLARQTLTEYGSLPDRSRGSVEVVVTDACWLLRNAGRAEEALRLLDQWLYSSPGVYHGNATHEAVTQVLLERVRILVKLQRWEEAEQQLAVCLEVLETTPRALDYYSWSTTYLMQGFLRQRREDLEGAQTAWKRGAAEGWKETVRQRFGDREPGTGGRVGDLHGLIMAALTDQLTDALGKQILDQTVASFSTDPVIAQLTSLINIPPSAARLMWQSPRGKDYAFKIAFRDLSFAETVYAPPILLGAEVLRQGAVGRQLTDEEAEVFWNTTEQGLKHFLSGKLSKASLFPLGLTWKGTTGILGWGAIRSKLDPELRGPMSFVLGHRFLKLGKPAEAETFFRTAHDDAPADSSLRRLAGAELAKLKKSP